MKLPTVYQHGRRAKYFGCRSKKHGVRWMMWQNNGSYWLLSQQKPHKLFQTKSKQEALEFIATGRRPKPSE